MADEAPRATDGRLPEGPPPDAEEGQSEARRAVVAQRVAALALAKDEEDLLELQRSGFAPERTPSRERLAAAKALVEHLGKALESNAEPDWVAIEASLDALSEAADEAAVTDKDRRRPDMATMSTDVPPAPEPGVEPTQRGDVSEVAEHLAAPRMPRGAADSERTAVSGIAMAEETLVSAVPVDALVAELAKKAELSDEAARRSKEARLAELAATNEATLAEAGVIDEAMRSARALLDSSETMPAEPSAAPSMRDSGAPARPGSVGSQSSEEGGTVQLSFSSMAHGFALTVEEYAALCAERDDDPSRVAALRARYGIPEVRGHAAIDRYFEQLFTRDPAMKALWQRHYQHYVALVQMRSQRR